MGREREEREHGARVGGKGGDKVDKKGATGRRGRGRMPTHDQRETRDVVVSEGMGGAQKK